ncbi:MAG: HPr family phosphocarrier protein [Pseudomonadota bacterium]
MNYNQKLTRRTSVKNELGMHARPASKIAQIAGEAKSDVWLSIDSQKSDAASIIDILSMCAVKGTQICVEIEDEADTLILDQIIDFFESGFGEI